MRKEREREREREGAVHADSRCLSLFSPLPHISFHLLVMDGSDHL